MFLNLDPSSGLKLNFPAKYMAEMDLDFDGPSKVPTRQSRFAPKSSKLKPQPETKPKIETLPQFDSAISTNKEELRDHLDENGSVTDKEDVPLEGETTGNDLAEDEEQVTDSDQDEVVREIDVCINPSFDPSTQVDFTRFKKCVVFLLNLHFFSIC